MNLAILERGRGKPSGTRVSLMKRLIEILFSLAGLVLLAIPMLFVAAVIRLTQGPPVLCREECSDLNGTNLSVLKFRTVNSNGEVTRFGQLLRSTKLDELPLLINILRGDMSLAEFLQSYHR
jgi:lipopolysaccharide/colanic/teichoic acid biosynthesis glycosyltransferase